MSQVGCCGNFMRFILGIVNVLFLLLGIALVVITCLVKWSNVFASVKNLKGVSVLFDLTAINGIAIAFIVIGGFAIVLSLFGLIGVTCLNRGFLVIYEIIVVILFLAHLIALIVLLAWASPKIETAFREQLNNTVDLINNASAYNVNITDQTQILLALSDVFDCCGINGPKDFKLNSTLYQCCKLPIKQNGCADASVEQIKKFSVYVLVIPTALILFIELVSIVMVPALICIISRSKSGTFM